MSILSALVNLKMTSFAAWGGVDSRGMSSFYFASDSRISWGIPAKWDAGRKLFASSTHPDIFGYCGDVLFPSLILSQVVDLVDHDLLFVVYEPPSNRFERLCNLIGESFELYPVLARRAFTIAYCSRIGVDIASKFELYTLSSFREALINSWQEDILALPEQALVGQYLSGDSEYKPSLQFLESLHSLEHRIEEWDMSGIISVFGERITTSNTPNDYYYIIREIAKLMRHELREFKTRYKLSMDKARANEFALPYRMALPRTGCGFVFVPLIHDFMERRLQFLEYLTYAHKYDQKLLKCIGVSFAPEEDGWYSVEWCYLEFPWQDDPELENRLQQSNPFREVRVAELSQYTFGSLEE